MSMLQQILDQMFVDPEILDALDEEQKQILFIKMREEQVKRWNAFEEQAEKAEKTDEPQSSKSKDDSRRIKWLLGEDGEVWVWVMGEHKDDLTIEQITEKRAFEQARQLAEKEMLENMRLTELSGRAPFVEPDEDENTLKEQLSRIKPWNSTNASSKIQESVYDDADSLFGSPFNGVFHSTSRVVPARESSLKGILKKSKENPLSDNKSSKGDLLSNDINTDLEQASGTDILTGSSKSNGSDERSQVSPSTSTPNINLNEAFLGSLNLTSSSSGSEIQNASYGAYTNYSPVSPESTGSDICHGLGKGDILSDGNACGMKTPEMPKNAARSTRMSGSPNGSFFIPPRDRLWNVNAQITPPQKNNSDNKTVVKFRPDFGPTHDLSDIDEELSKRQSEIFEQIKEKHQQFDREAELEAKCVEQAWEEQEKRAREAEAQIRRIAQRAREQHRQQSLRTSNIILPVLSSIRPSPLRSALKSLTRPPKPRSREVIINWFKNEELRRGTGLDPETLRPAVWFHGIIPRTRADRMLQKKPAGSFLVRVSERIWGYTLSYVVGDGTIKHFLIETMPQGYQFMGINQVVHRHLHELIAFHKISPITIRGNELLRWAVGQVDTGLPDYADLISYE
uniref:SH2 domain-containing protein n=1 Tax=Elaeophora elaphi TaxID=1147741 RepID=A0A0R3S133_9BILA